jgi:hypothetical protein
MKPMKCTAMFVTALMCPTLSFAHLPVTGPTDYFCESSYTVVGRVLSAKAIEAGGCVTNNFRTEACRSTIPDLRVRILEILAIHHRSLGLRHTVAVGDIVKIGITVRNDAPGTAASEAPELGFVRMDPPTGRTLTQAQVDKLVLGQDFIITLNVDHDGNPSWDAYAWPAAMKAEVQRLILGFAVAERKYGLSPTGCAVAPN